MTTTTEMYTYTCPNCGEHDSVGTAATLYWHVTGSGIGYWKLDRGFAPYSTVYCTECMHPGDEDTFRHRPTPPRYNSACSLNFEILHDDEDGDDLTVDSIRKTISARLAAMSDEELLDHIRGNLDDTMDTMDESESPDWISAAQGVSP